MVALPPESRPSLGERARSRLARVLSGLLPRRFTHPGGRGIDIVIPVHDAADHVRRCVRSVLRHARGDWRLVLVDDASRDAGLVAWMDDVAQRYRRVVVVRNAFRRGFVVSANRGLRGARGRDVVLLNSDTVVTAGFLGRLAACAYAAPDTGLVSPFTNNGTICSFPRFLEPNEIPAEIGIDGMGEIVRRASRRLRPELVTAVGFCIYVRADLVERIGYLDTEHFGDGYGEENDYSLRARAAGFRVRLCDDVFVAHAGRASFGERGDAAENAHNEVIGRLYPSYHDDVQRFIREDPLAEARAAAATALEHALGRAGA